MEVPMTMLDQEALDISLLEAPDKDRVSLILKCQEDGTVTARLTMEAALPEPDIYDPEAEEEAPIRITWDRTRRPTRGAMRSPEQGKRTEPPPTRFSTVDRVRPIQKKTFTEALKAKLPPPRKSAHPPPPSTKPSTTRPLPRDQPTGTVSTTRKVTPIVQPTPGNSPTSSLG